MSLPVALDTNVLVRLLVNDDPSQAEQAAALIDASAEPLSGTGRVWTLPMRSTWLAARAAEC
jgi:predicted nucleic acid-binding protein